MQNRFYTIILIASSALYITSCGDNSSFESSNGSTPSNSGLISQKNFTILFSEVAPKFFDVTTGEISPVTSDVIVQVGDNNNQLITSSHTIFFKTEWGLIDPSCETDQESGKCTVTWRSGSIQDVPTDYKNTIIAYSPNGQESFTDINGNGLFDDTDSFDDIAEPFIDVNDNNVFDTGIDFVIDVVNGNDSTGTNAVHDIPDLLFNGPSCIHSSLCSPTATSTVWEGSYIDVSGNTAAPGGGGGGDPTTPNFPLITLHTHIPDGGNPLPKVYMGNSTSQFVYLTLDGPAAINRAEANGQTVLENANVNFTAFDKAISGDSSVFVHNTSGITTNGMFVIDVATATSQQIGAALGSFVVTIDVLALTDDGSVVAFIDDQDLTGANPGNFGQIFTLTTDGSDVITQVSSFAADYFITDDFEFALSGNGTTIFFHSKSDVLTDGSNADGSDEIYSIDTDGSNLTLQSNMNLDLATDIVEIKTDTNASSVLFLTSESELRSLIIATSTVVTLDTLIVSGRFLLGLPVYQFDLSSDGSTIYYSTRNEISVTENEKLIFSISPDGTNKQQVFTTGTLSGAIAGDWVRGIETTSDGSTVTFFSNFNFGKTVDGEDEDQIYSLSP